MRGKTKIYRMDQSFIPINESFFFALNKKSNIPIYIKLITKNIIGKEEQIGDLKLQVPKSVYKNAQNYFSYGVQTNYGEFVINISFNVIKEKALLPASNEFYEEPEIDDYLDLLEEIFPIESSKPPYEDFWNQANLFERIEKLKKSRGSNAIIEELSGYTESLSDIANECESNSNFIAKIMYYLNEPFPIFMNQKGENVIGNDILEEYNTCYSLLALFICEYTKKINNEPSKNYCLDFPLIIICNSFSIIINDPNIEIIWLLYITSTSLFISKYFKDNFNDKFLSVIGTLNIIADYSLKCFINKIENLIKLNYDSPKILGAIIAKNYRLLELTLFNDEICDEIYSYLSKLADFYITQKMVLSTMFPINFPLPNYVEIFSDFNWPLLSSLAGIRDKLHLILNGNIKINTLPIAFNGKWLFNLLKKYNKSLPKPINEVKITKLFKNINSEPNFQLFEDFVDQSKALKSLDIRLPSQLPEFTVSNK